MKKLLHWIFWHKYYHSLGGMDGAKIDNDNKACIKKHELDIEWKHKTIKQKLIFIRYLIKYYLWSFWGNLLL